MTDQPKSRTGARIQAATLACLLMAAAPALAQDTTAPTAGTAPETQQTAPATAAPAAPAQTAPVTSAPATPATPSAAPAETPAAQAQTAQSPAPQDPAPQNPAALGATAQNAPAQNTTAPNTTAQNTTAQEAAPAASTAQDAPAQSASPTATNGVQSTATDTAPPAPATPAATAPAGADTPAATPTAEAAATPSAPNAPVDPATTATTTAPTVTPTPTVTPATTGPASAPEAAPAEADSGVSDSLSILPEPLQRALAPVLETAERDPNLPHDLSPIGMFLAADIVVKGVMIGLAFASVVTWTVLIVKVLELWGASGRASRARRRIESARDLTEAVAATNGRGDPSSRMIRAAANEYERSLPALVDGNGEDGLKDRISSHLRQIEANAGRKISRGTGVLATIGSTAPFVGLFGTVWGIMNSFIGISEAQTTNLAIVAPGIAEALLATAIGLVAAIPAVVIYNVFARAITGYRLNLASNAAGIERIVSRDLDFRTGV